MDIDEIISAVRDVFNGAPLKDIIKKNDLEEKFPGLEFGKVIISSYDIEEDEEEGRIHVNFKVRVDVKVLDCSGEAKVSGEYVMKGRSLVKIDGIYSDITLFGDEDVKKSMNLDGWLFCTAYISD